MSMTGMALYIDTNNYICIYIVIICYNYYIASIYSIYNIIIYMISILLLL